MSAPLSFCDISARYGQTPAPRSTLEEQTGWNASALFTGYLNKVRQKREEDEEHAAEDALMAMIDVMNAPEEERLGRQDRVAVQSLMKAGATAYRSEKFEKIRKTFDGEVSVTVMPEVRAMMAILGDASTFKQADDIQEEEQKELAEEKERLEVTETRGPSEISEPYMTGKEV